MIKLPAAGAAALLLCLLGISDARAWCDEDCAYEAHEAAYERAAEREYAREEAEEEGYATGGNRGDRSSRSARRNSDGRADQRSPPAAKRVAEPKPVPPVDKRPAATKVATENSSIATGNTLIAVDDSLARGPSQRELGCKTFFPSVGMTLSVPCD